MESINHIHRHPDGQPDRFQKADKFQPMQMAVNIQVKVAVFGCGTGGNRTE